MRVVYFLRGESLNIKNAQILNGAAICTVEVNVYPWVVWPFSPLLYWKEGIAWDWSPWLQAWAKLRIKWSSIGQNLHCFTFTILPYIQRGFSAQRNSIYAKKGSLVQILRFTLLTVQNQFLTRPWPWVSITPNFGGNVSAFWEKMSSLRRTAIKQVLQFLLDPWHWLSFLLLFPYLWKHKAPNYRLQMNTHKNKTAGEKSSS